MGSLNKDTLWWNTKNSEVILLQLSFALAKNMFFCYVIPIVKRIYPVLSDAVSRCRLSSPSKFTQNKIAIASLLKSVYGKVKVYVVSDVDTCNDLIKRCMLGESHVKFVGLDCEWVSTRKNGVSLLQISSGNDCILYRACENLDVFPERLKELLENRKILKFGVGLLEEDTRRLHSYGVNVNGIVDLRNLVDRCFPPSEDEGSAITSESRSLASLSKNVLDIHLIKSYLIRCSNWEENNLQPSQILYAAKDGIVSLEIFYALVLFRKLKRDSQLIFSNAFEKDLETINNWLSDESHSQNLGNPISPNVYLYCHEADSLEDVKLPRSFGINKPSPWFVDLAHSLCQGITDVKYKTRNGKNSVSQTSAPRSRGLSKSGKVKEYRHQCRDKPLYENCFLKGPDGATLATVNRSKASWYVHKNLGEVTCEDPYTVNLFFEPSGRPMPDADYYTTIKDNVCVVCEGTESFVRKMIIPHDYRRYFPLQLKDHMSHDVLLMCLQCHRSAQMWDERLRQELAAKYNAPLGTKDQRMHLDNPKLSKVKSAAKALHHSGSKIPEARAKVLRAVIEEYCGPEEVTDDVIKELSIMDVKEANRTFGEPHGKRVVDAFVGEKKLPEFIRMWRQHFLTNMQPKHLPPMWSVEHNLDKLRAIKLTDGE